MIRKIPPFNHYFFEFVRIRREPSLPLENVFIIRIERKFLSYVKGTFKGLNGAELMDPKTRWVMQLFCGIEPMPVLAGVAYQNDVHISYLLILRELSSPGIVHPDEYLKKEAEFLKYLFDFLNLSRLSYFVE